MRQKMTNIDIINAVMNSSNPVFTLLKRTYSVRQRNKIMSWITSLPEGLINCPVMFGSLRPKDFNSPATKAKVSYAIIQDRDRFGVGFAMKNPKDYDIPRNKGVDDTLIQMEAFRLALARAKRSLKIARRNKVAFTYYYDKKEFSIEMPVKG